MRNLKRALLASGLGFAVSLIAACGGGAGLLTGDQANTLNSKASEVSSALAAGHCGAAKTAARGLVQEVANLPNTVDGSLRQNLDLGATTISQLASQQCHPVATQPQTTPTTTSTPTTTATTTTPTTTTPTTTATTTTPTTTTTTTTTGSGGGSSGGGGLGGGSGSGGSGGGGTGGSGGGSGGAAGGAGQSIGNGSG